MSVNIDKDFVEGLLINKFKCGSNTAKTYLYNFNRVCKNCNIKHETNDYISDNIINSVIEYCNKQSKGVCNTLLNSYLKCVSALGYDISGFNDKFTNIIQSNYKDLQLKEASEKEKEKLLELNDIIKIRDDHKTKLNNKFNKYDVYYVLLCLYTMLPPLRSQDYCDSFLLYDSSNEKEIEDNMMILKECNYLCLKNKKLYINKSKTSKHYGSKIIDIPDELIQILTNFKNKSNSTYVICSTKNKYVTTNNFVPLFKEALNGHSASSSTMRKIFISEKVVDSNMKPEERKEVARIMGHSISTQSNTYSKYSKLLHTNDNDIKELYKQRAVLLEQLAKVDEKIMKCLESHNSSST